MELRRTETGFALYKEKEVIGHCTLHPAAQGADLAALAIDPAWRRKGYGSYLLKEVLRSFGGYDREAATVFTAPLPADCAEMAFWAKFGFAAEGPQLVRRRTPDLTAVKFVQDFLAARLVHPRLCVDATCGNGGDTAFLCRLTAPEGRVLGFDIQPEAIASTRARLEQAGVPAGQYALHCDSHAHLLQYVQPGTADAVMFNFGWLPGGRPRGVLHRRQQHPRAGSRPAGGAPRWGGQRHPVQRGGHRHRRKAGGAGLAAGTSAERFHRSGVRFCQLGRNRPSALLHPEKITKALALSRVFV